MSVTIALKIVTNRPRFIIIPKIKNFKCFVRYFANLTVLSPHQKNPLGFWGTKPKANLNKSVNAFVQVCRTRTCLRRVCASDEHKVTNRMFVHLLLSTSLLLNKPLVY